MRENHADPCFKIQFMKKGIIIGAGIGGLSTAIALQRKGIETDIYEQAPAIREVGAGIWVAPNGLKVFQELGIAEEIIAAGTNLHRISVTDLNYRTISIIDGESVKQKHGFMTVAIHRARLQAILASHIPSEKIHLNKKVRSYEQTKDQVRLNFEDGSTTTADFVIDASGIKSPCRLQMQGDHQLRYSGQTCWRFVADFRLPDNEQHHMYEMWSGKKGLRVGYSAITPTQVYVYITDYVVSGGQDNPASVTADLLRTCSEFPSLLQDMIRAAKPGEIIRSDIFDFKPISNWTDGRLALLGDAAHATTPNLGQGACQAIEDALAMAEALSAHEDVNMAFLSFQEKRKPKTAYITNTSWRFEQMTNTTGLTKKILMSLLRMAPEKMNQREIDKIYNI